jgi:3-phenylpropionate/trans-cinnamate dioxygenase ferredoxin component
MSETNIQFHSVCKITDITDGERLFIEINNIPVVLFNIKGAIYAIDDICTHDDGPLGEGDLEEYEITCPRHGARFDVRTGKALFPPAVVDDHIYPIQVDGDEIKIGLPG